MLFILGYHTHSCRNLFGSIVACIFCKMFQSNCKCMPEAETILLIRQAKAKPRLPDRRASIDLTTFFYCIDLCLFFHLIHFAPQMQQTCHLMPCQSLQGLGATERFIILVSVNQSAFRHVIKNRQIFCTTLHI